MNAATPAELEAFLDGAFPGVERALQVVEVGEGTLRARLPAGAAMVRPGGIVSGPSLMALCDTVVYLLVAAAVGPEEMAVTSDLAIRFLRPAPHDADLVADGRLLKLGRRQAVGVVEVRSAAAEGLVAHATVTYALPSPG